MDSPAPSRDSLECPVPKKRDQKPKAEKRKVDEASLHGDPTPSRKRGRLDDRFVQTRSPPRWFRYLDPPGHAMGYHGEMDQLEMVAGVASRQFRVGMRISDLGHPLTVFLGIRTATQLALYYRTVESGPIGHTRTTKYPQTSSDAYIWSEVCSVGHSSST